MKVAGNDIRMTIYQMQFTGYDFSSQKYNETAKFH